MKKISIIIPIYNSAMFLRACLDSVVHQSLKEIEVILIDDCSTDESRSICEEYKGDYPFVKLYCFGKNQGAAAARNAGLDLATGEYILFVDSDDTVDLLLCESLYGRAQINKPDILMFNVIDNVSGFGPKFFSDGLYQLEDIKRELFPKLLAYIDENGWISATRWCLWLRMIRREFLAEHSIRFDDRFRRCQDLHFIFLATIHAYKFEYFGEGYLYYQNIRNDSLSRGYNAGLFDLLNPLIIELDRISSAYHDYDFSDQVTMRALNFLILCFANERKSTKTRKEKLTEIKKILEDSVTQDQIKKAKKLKMNRYKSIIRLMKQKKAECILDNRINYNYGIISRIMKRLKNVKVQFFM